MTAPHSRSHAQTGFSLVELIMVIVIMGIIAATLTIFLVPATKGYFDTVRRTQLVDTAEFALRRIARDLTQAVPNSIRSSDSLYVEMLALRAGGRYCNGNCGVGSNQLIDSDRTFTLIGPGVTTVAGDFFVAGNLPTSLGCDAYIAPATGIRRTLTTFGPDLTTLSWSPSEPLLTNDCAQLTKRFHVFGGAVTYACDSASSTLWRYDNYGINPTAPGTVADAMAAAAAGRKAALATNVLCSATGFDVTQVGGGLVELRIKLQDASGESVSLYRQVRVDNSP